jgi:8-oxo-dGTP diphosphatase
VRPTVRPACREDLPLVGAIYEAAAEEQESLKPGWKIQAGWGKAATSVIADVVEDHVLGGYPAAAFVGEIDGEICGYVIASVEEFPGGRFAGSTVRTKLHHLVVDAAARGVGLGELLLAVAVRWGRALGANICEMEVLPGHRAAKNFCEAHGIKARSITMSGSIDDVTSSIELDEDEALSVTQAVDAVLPETVVDGARPREVAAGCIVVSEGRVLLAKRSEPPFAGHWSIPGGRPILGETLAECARRELFEETEIRVRIIGLAGIAERRWEIREGESKNYVIVNFVGIPDVDRDSPAALTEGDGFEIAWAVPGDIPEPTVPGVKSFLDRARHIIEAVSDGRVPPGSVIYSPPTDKD